MKRIWIDRGLALFIFGLSIFLYATALEFPLDGDLFPRFTLILMMALSAVIGIQTLKGRSAFARQDVSGQVSRKRMDRARPYLLFGICLLYALLIYAGGYWIGSIVTALLMMLALGTERKLLYGLVAGGMILLVYLLFSFIFAVDLPVGIWFA